MSVRLHRGGREVRSARRKAGAIAGTGSPTRGWLLPRRAVAPTCCGCRCEARVEVGASVAGLRRWLLLLLLCGVTSSGHSCARAARECRPRTWDCLMTAPAAARRACGARSWPRSPASGCPGIRGLSRGATSTLRRRCWMPWRGRCAWTPPNGRRCLPWHARSCRCPRVPELRRVRIQTTVVRCSCLSSRGCTRRPAYLLGPLTRILAWNPAASALFGSPDHLSPERRSLLWIAAGRPRQRAVQTRAGRGPLATWWPASAASTRSTPASPAYEQFIAELRERSPWFVAWWGEHEVNDTQRGTKTIEHPTLGTLRLHHAQTVPTGAPDLRLTIYAPADAATRVALAKSRVPDLVLGGGIGLPSWVARSSRCMSCSSELDVAGRDVLLEVLD